MIVLGIDPGLDGAVAVINHGYPLMTATQVLDTPTAKDGKHRVYLPTEMKAILVNVVGGKTCCVFIERVHAMPKQGVSSSFNFGVGYGLWQGLVAGLGLPVEFVTPQAWQKEMLAGMQGGKDASRIRAQQLFPEIHEQFSRKKDDGRADAILIAEFGRRRLG